MLFLTCVKRNIQHLCVCVCVCVNHANVQLATIFAI